MSISFPQQKTKWNLPTSIRPDVLHMNLSEATTLPTSQVTGQTAEATANGMLTPITVAVQSIKDSATPTLLHKPLQRPLASLTTKVTMTVTTMVTSRPDSFASGPHVLASM